MTDTIIAGSDLDRLAANLEREARASVARSQSDHIERPKSWIVIDLEFIYDRLSHDAYMTCEGKGAEQAIRWPFHKVAATSWMKISFMPGQTSPEIEGPFVRTAEATDEKAIVSELFGVLAASPDAVVTTWGGEARDFAVLRRCATTHDLQLPSQLIDGSPNARERLDLCRVTCVQAPSVHLPEMAAAVSVPAKPSPSKTIGLLCESGDWGAVAEQVRADVLTTTILTVRHLAAHGQVQCQRGDTIIALAASAVLAAPDSDFVRRTFVPWARGQKAASGLRGAVYRAVPSPMAEA